MHKGTQKKCVSNNDKHLMLEDIESDQESVFDNPRPILSEADEESDMKSEINEIERCESLMSRI